MTRIINKNVIIDKNSIISSFATIGPNTNISESVFNELSNYTDLYRDYIVEKIHDPDGIDRNNYYMKTIFESP